MTEGWLSIIYDEDEDTWSATIQDDRGRSIITIKRKAPKETRKDAKKAVGVVGGADHRADENYRGHGVINPKSPQKVAAEVEADWVRKNIIEQATKPEDHL